MLCSFFLFLFYIWKYRLKIFIIYVCKYEKYQYTAIFEIANCLCFNEFSYNTKICQTLVVDHRYKKNHINMLHLLIYYKVVIICYIHITNLSFASVIFYMFKYLSHLFCLLFQHCLLVVMCDTYVISNMLQLSYNVQMHL